MAYLLHEAEPERKFAKKGTIEYTIIQIKKGSETIDDLKNLIKADKSIVNTITESGASILGYSLSRGTPETSELLIKNGADIKHITATKDNTLAWACTQAENIEIVKYLLSKGIDPAFPNSKAYNPFQIACIHTFPEIVKAILENSNIDVNMIHRPTEFNALFYPIRGIRDKNANRVGEYSNDSIIKTVEVLINAGINTDFLVDAKDDNRGTDVPECSIVDYALIKKGIDEDLVDSLIDLLKNKNKLSPTIINKPNTGTLYLALLKDYKTIASRLIDLDVNLDYMGVGKDKNINKLFMQACAIDSFEIVEKLLTNGATFNEETLAACELASDSNSKSIVFLRRHLDSIQNSYLFN